MRARVLFIGGFRHSYSTEVHLARDLEAIGCDVFCLTESSLREQLALGDVPALRDEFDLALYMKLRGLPDEAEQLWRRFEEHGTKTASYHLDLYVGLAREVEVGRNPFWRTGTVFTADGDPHSAEVFASHGINHRWLPPAIVSDECKLGEFDYELACDVAFVGTADGYHKEWPWRARLVEALQSQYRDRFKLITHQTRPIVRGQRLNNLCASAKVVVGDSLAPISHTRYWSDRYCEIAGRGGALVAPFIEGMDETLASTFTPYEIGDTRSLFATIDECMSYTERVAYLRRAWASGRISEHHTYRQRGEQLLQEVGL